MDEEIPPVNSVRLSHLGMNDTYEVFIEDQNIDSSKLMLMAMGSMHFLKHQNGKLDPDDMKRAYLLIMGKGGQ